MVQVSYLLIYGQLAGAGQALPVYVNGAVLNIYPYIALSSIYYFPDIVLSNFAKTTNSLSITYATTFMVFLA